MMEVIDSMWFSSMYGQCGFVIGENEKKERILYAGVARGGTQKDDEQSVIDYGSKVNIGMLESFIAVAKQKGD